MDILDENIKKEVKDYENKINSVDDESFKSQFKLQEVNGLIESSKQRFSMLSNPSIYNPHKDFSMLESSRFENLNSVPSGRRDNTLLMNEYFTVNKRKVETDKLLKRTKNPNALLASGVIYNQNLDNIKNRMSTKIKNNEYNTETMYLRTENVDGVPINENVRSLPKTQNELRSNTINSQRLSSDNRINGVKVGVTKSKNPEDEKITKFKKQTYREQKTSDDFIKTTGIEIKPEFRSKIEIFTNRTKSIPIIGNAKTAVNKDFFRNNQPLRKTIKEETVINEHITNTKSVVEKPMYKNNQEAKTTDRETNNTHITNLKSEINKSSYHNNQEANKTLRETENDQITNAKSRIDKQTFKNNQDATPTDRETHNTQITNPKSEINKSMYHNNQNVRQTLRETNNEHITNTKSLVDSSYIKNNQSATTTIREQTEDNLFTGGATDFTMGNVYHNNQPTNQTIKEQTIETNYSGVGYSETQGVLYKNNQPATKTLRENEKNISGTAYSNSGYIHHNNNKANETIRGTTGNTSYSGPSHISNNRTYIKSVDKTRSGVVEEVLSKDYKGSSGSMVTETQSRDFIDNYEQYERLEKGLDLTNIEPIGGYGRIGIGKQNFGKQSNKDTRGIKENVKIPRSMVGSNYISENETYLQTRGKENLQKRININPHLENSLNGNPYINNNVFKSISKKDIIFEKTNNSDRILDEVKEIQQEYTIKY